MGEPVLKLRLLLPFLEPRLEVPTIRRPAARGLVGLDRVSDATTAVVELPKNLIGAVRRLIQGEHAFE